MKRIICILVILGICSICKTNASAMEMDADDSEQIISGYDFKEADQMLKENGYTGGFQELIREVLSENNKSDQGIFKILWNKICKVTGAEWKDQKGRWISVLTLALLSAFLSNFMNSFSKEGISEIGCLIVYLAILGLLFGAFMQMQALAEQYINLLSKFMKVTIPGLMIAVGVAGKSLSAAAFYEIALAVIYGVNWILIFLLLPMVQIYVGVSLVNGISKEDMFSKTTDMLETWISWILKTMVAVVIGVSVIRGMIIPSMDAFKNTSAGKILELFPVIGKANSLTQLLIGSGRIIKNGIGTAMLISLVVLCSVPLLKLTLFGLIYQGTSALIQPVTKQELSESILAIAKGTGFLMRIMLTQFVLFFVLISLICILTNLS